MENNFDRALPDDGDVQKEPLPSLFGDIPDIYYHSSREGNVTSDEIVLGAQPQFYADWHWITKLLAFLAISFSCLVNCGVMAIYHKLRLKTSMHEIHVCHLAVCDFVCAIFASMPIVTGHIRQWHGKPLGSGFYVPCFVASVGMHSCNMLATFICIFISYDRLQLLNLGVQYRPNANRLIGTARLVIAWSAMICFTTTVSSVLLGTSFGESLGDCIVTFSYRGIHIKIIMTIIAIGPLAILVYMNILVQDMVQEMEEKHLIADKPSVSGAVPTSNSIDPESVTVTQYEGVAMGLRSVSPVITFSAASPSQTSIKSEGANSLGKHSSAHSSKSVSARAMATVFASTIIFVICLGPLTILLLIEAWTPGTIQSSTHRWHIWFTLVRCSVDPYLFARNLPSFRLFYGTEISRLEDRWIYFAKTRMFLCEFVCCWCSDFTVVDDARAKLDKHRRKTLRPGLSRMDADSDGCGYMLPYGSTFHPNDEGSTVDGKMYGSSINTDTGTCV